MNIWNDVLLKWVSNEKLKKARSVSQTESNEFQIFEVLIAESLNLCDRYAKWEVTRGRSDKGIDLIGTEKQVYQNPFEKNIIHHKILGQVKRHARNYPYDKFQHDISKAYKYCVNTEFYEKNSFSHFVFILSTDIKNGVHNLRSRFQKELELKQDADFISRRPGHIQIQDAAELMKIWKLNFSYFKDILDEALSTKQLQLLFDFVNKIDYSWLSISIAKTEPHYTGEPFEYLITINIDMEHIDIDLKVKWYPSENNNIQLLHPLMALNPLKDGFPLRIQKSTSFKLIFRGFESGEYDCGVIEIFSSEMASVIKKSLGHIKLNPGFFPYFFDSPNSDLLLELKNLLSDKTKDFVPFSVTGCGGIGKSTIINEALIYASGHDYLCIDIAQPKDLQHPRFLLIALFRQLIYPNVTKIKFESSAVFEIQNFLHSKYNPIWENDINIFFEKDDKECNISNLYECFASVLVEATRHQKMLIWLKDLHWLTHETLNIFKHTINLFCTDKACLFNKLIFIFEGREDEVFVINSIDYFPKDWYLFLQNDLLIKRNLKLWSNNECRSFLQDIFSPDQIEKEIYTNLSENILKYSKGIPMHILEHLRLLINRNKINIGSGHKLIISDMDFTDCFSDEILYTIRNRVCFFRKDYSDFIDVLTIIAIYKCDIPSLLYIRLIDFLKKKYLDYHQLIKRSRFVTEENKRIYFLHEHYFTIFSEELILNNDVINICLNYYKEKSKLSDKDVFDLILLRQKQTIVNENELKKEIVRLICRTKNLTIRFELYLMLLNFPEDDSFLPHYSICFEVCEIMIRTGSWDKALIYLEKMRELIDYNDINNLCYQIAGFQEKANILGDRMKFDFAIKTANEGLELVDICLRDKKLNSRKLDELMMYKEKLQARLAVCYWFSGDLNKGTYFQNICYNSAIKRKDDYSVGHVVYEIGTLKFHNDIDEGIRLIEKLLNNIENIPSLYKYEKTLIEVQLLIGKIMKASTKADYDLLTQVKFETRRLADFYKKEKHSYEEFLCYTIRGICFFLEKDKTQALYWFFESLKSASLSETSNIVWKAYFNISQIYFIEGDVKTSQDYAQKCLDILIIAYRNNPITGQSFLGMIASVIEKLKEILNKDINEFEDISIKEKERLLSVHSEHCEFIIMN